MNAIVRFQVSRRNICHNDYKIIFKLTLEESTKNPSQCIFDTSKIRECG